MEKGQLVFAERMKAFQPARWEQIPDLGLYMDQVVTYLERQLRPLMGEGERLFTPSMVNNYVKMGLVDRPMDKKYGREQLAQLLMVAMLKLSTTAEEMKQLLKIPKDSHAQAVYEQFCMSQSEMFQELLAALPLPTPMDAALRGAGYRLLFASSVVKENPLPTSKTKEGGGEKK